ncbi:hypothetical protein PTKIN_Ptkin06aG0121800 [Pterospermum kingtungense]
MCEEHNETIEHLLFTCSLGRASWFGIDLSIRMDQMNLISIKEWIKDWLMKDELVKEEALWFYGQFLCTMWCIWLRRNDKVFRNTTPDPNSIIRHQKILFCRIAMALNSQKAPT